MVGKGGCKLHSQPRGSTDHYAAEQGCCKHDTASGRRKLQCCRNPSSTHSTRHVPDKGKHCTLEYASRCTADPRLSRIRPHDETAVHRHKSPSTLPNRPTCNPSGKASGPGNSPPEADRASLGRCKSGRHLLARHIRELVSHGRMMSSKHSTRPNAHLAGTAGYCTNPSRSSVHKRDRCTFALSTLCRNSSNTHPIPSTQPR